MQIPNLDEKDTPFFREWVKDHLHGGAVKVTFTKRDGSERVMECTTSPELVPAEPIVEGAGPKREKKANDDVMPVYDLEAKGWRSFRWDSLKGISITIGEENV